MVWLLKFFQKLFLSWNPKKLKNITEQLMTLMTSDDDDDDNCFHHQTNKQTKKKRRECESHINTPHHTLIMQCERPLLLLYDKEKEICMPLNTIDSDERIWPLLFFGFKTSMRIW